MRKEYERPVVEMVEFQTEEIVMSDDTAGGDGYGGGLDPSGDVQDGWV